MNDSMNLLILMFGVGNFHLFLEICEHFEFI